MGYSYYDTDSERGPAGYGVTDTCHEQGCENKIDRGLAYLCGDNPISPDTGCGWWYCYSHLFMGDDGQVCKTCFDLRPAGPSGREGSEQ